MVPESFAMLIMRAELRLLIAQIMRDYGTTLLMYAMEHLTWPILSA